MAFDNDKKTFLAKQDKSKKGSIDDRVKPILDFINALPDYYTTSSCSGRVYLWRGSGKKNETEWVKVSHNLITTEFFQYAENGLIWLRFEPFILHVRCRDLKSATSLLQKSQQIYKKSALLASSNKFILEIRGSEFLEMPLYQDGTLLFAGEMGWLRDWINHKMEENWKRMGRLFEKEIKKYLIYLLFTTTANPSTTANTSSTTIPPNNKT